ncbi:MAG: hypothetical protein K5894_07475 [Lachnospiraceae bacterium]|nr:hypothetical protein [Lachnospiraceae bacterium]
MEFTSLDVTPVMLSFIEDMKKFYDIFFIAPYRLVMQKALAATVALISKIVVDFLARRFYWAWVAILKFIWILEQVFDIFAGTVGVYVKNGSGWTVSSGNKSIIQDSNFMEVLFNGNAIQTAYAYAMLASFALCFLFTVFAVIRSMGDSIGENKHPVTEVLRLCSKACVTFLLIPLACLLVLKFSSVTMSVIADIGEEDQKLCDTLYVVGVGDCFKNENYRVEYSYSRKFASTGSIKAVNYKDINYILAFVSSIFCAVLMMVCILQAIMRMFILLLLFVLSPYFVSTMPLDDGAKFKKWQKMFIGFAISTFGPIITMKVYMIIIPLVASSNSAISIYGGYGTLSQLINSAGGKSFWNWNDASQGYLVQHAFQIASEYIFKMIMILGGAFASWKSQYVILEVIDPQMVYIMKRGEIIAGVTKQAVTKGASAVGKVGSFIGNKISGKGKNGGGGN